MTPVSAMLVKLAERWESDAATLRGYGAEPQADCMTRAARELRAALTAAADEPLTLDQASAESGVPAETLRKQLARGVLPQAGKKGAPRIRRADLPVRPPAARAAAGARGFDPDAFVRKLHPDRY